MTDEIEAAIIAIHVHDWECETGGHATDPRDCQECDHLRAILPRRRPDMGSERGRLLAERDRLIAAGVDPADLELLDL